MSPEKLQVLTPFRFMGYFSPSHRVPRHFSSLLISIESKIWQKMDSGTRLEMMCYIAISVINIYRANNMSYIQQNDITLMKITMSYNCLHHRAILFNRLFESSAAEKHANFSSNCQLIRTDSEKGVQTEPKILWLRKASDRLRDNCTSYGYDDNVLFEAFSHFTCTLIWWKHVHILS